MLDMLQEVFGTQITTELHLLLLWIMQQQLMLVILPLTGIVKLFGLVLVRVIHHDRLMPE